MNKEFTEVVLEADVSFRFSFDIDVLAHDWQKANGDNSYLSIAYLNALENSEIDRIDYVYAVVYRQQKPVGVLYFQLLEVGNVLFNQKKFPNTSFLELKKFT